MADASRHSIKVPRLFKTACKIAKLVREERKSLKELVYSGKHPNIKALYALVVQTLQHEKELDTIFEKSKILEKEKGLDPWLARVLITELTWGKKRLSGESKPVKTVLAYKSSFIIGCGGIVDAGNKLKEVDKGSKLQRSRRSHVRLIKSYCHIMENNPPKGLETLQHNYQPELNISTQSNAEIASALGSLLLYSAAMFTLPIGAFYGVRHVLWDVVGVKDFANTVCSVAVAVVVVNMIIASYAIKAFREEEKTPKNIKVN